jgi:hypothetical protein
MKIERILLPGELPGFSSRQPVRRSCTKTRPHNVTLALDMGAKNNLSGFQRIFASIGINEFSAWSSSGVTRPKASRLESSARSFLCSLSSSSKLIVLAFTECQSIIMQPLGQSSAARSQREPCNKTRDLAAASSQILPHPIENLLLAEETRLCPAQSLVLPLRSETRRLMALA